MGCWCSPFLTQLYSPIRSLGSLANRIFAASAAAERIIEFLDQKPSVIEVAVPLRRDGPARSAAFEGVRFGYPESDRAALEDISFRVDTGETLALVGASGAGKSTIAKLLLRFYDPQEGRVTMDGTDLRNLSLGDREVQVAVTASGSARVRRHNR